MRIWIDGSGALLLGQKGKACVVFEGGEAKVVQYARATNNEMEYQALLNALEDHRSDHANIYTDSKLLVGHIVEGWNVKAPNLKGLNSKCARRLKERDAELVWVRRGENRAGKVLDRRK